MSICRARLRNTSNALTFQMPANRYVFKSNRDCSESTAGWTQMTRQWIPDGWSGDRKCTGPKSVVNSWNWQLMTSGRSQMLATRHFGDWHTVVSEVPWSSVLKTTMDCHSKLVLHSLGNNQPVQVVVHQRRQTALIFPGPCDQTCCSILNMLQLVHDLLRCRGQNWVAIVNTRCNKGVDQCLHRLRVQRATNTSQLAKPARRSMFYRQSKHAMEL